MDNHRKSKIQKSIRPLFAHLTLETLEGFTLFIFCFRIYMLQCIFLRISSCATTTTTTTTPPPPPPPPPTTTTTTTTTTVTTQVDYEVMKVENHELRKRVLAAQGDGGFSTSTERCWGEGHSNDSGQIIATYSLPVGYPIWWFSKGNSLQHPVLSGLGNIVSCPDDWICWDENMVFKQSLSPFVLFHPFDIDVLDICNQFCWRICDLLVWTFLYNCHELAISNLYLGWVCNCKQNPAKLPKCRWMSTWFK